jgi:hypothetical protein
LDGIYKAKGDPVVWGTYWAAGRGDCGVWSKVGEGIAWGSKKDGRTSCAATAEMNEAVEGIEIGVSVA